MALFSARYAKAFAEAISDSKLDPTMAELQLDRFAAVLAESAELREAMESPAITSEEKLKVLDAILKKTGSDKLVRNLLAVLMDHNRLTFLPEVLAEYRSIVDAQKGITEVKITSALPLSAESRALLETKIGTMTGAGASSKVRAQYSEDSSLLGGVVVRLGSTIYDGSVQGRLNRLKQELLKG
jgi:F-type H+-transporting ATPase subunit delta